MDENAALIAEHLETAGELHAAYGWHMRAGAWSATRDIAAAWLSWERARRVADALPDDPNRTALRIAPRTLLCGSGWRVHANVSGLFEELQQLCSLAGDKASLAVGMTGLVMDHMMHARIREASRLGSEQVALLESLGDPTLMVGLSFAAILSKVLTVETADMLRWSQTVIDLAEGDPAKGNLLIGSPLAAALVMRGFARWCLGQPGWRDDLDHAVAMARTFDPISHGFVVNVTYGPAITCGVLLADDAALRDLDEAQQMAERSADDSVLCNVRLGLSRALVHRDSPADRERGLDLLGQVRDMCLRERFFMSELPMVEVHAARERARRGDRDGALPQMRSAVEELFNKGQFGWFIPATAVLAETLLERGTEDDVAEARAAIDRLAVTPADDGLVIRDVIVLRLRALLARARGDEVAYPELVSRYREMAESRGFEGHMAMANSMT